MPTRPATHHRYRTCADTDTDLAPNADRDSDTNIDATAISDTHRDSDGYRLLSVDSNNYDAEYWIHNFLNADFVKDDIFHTRNYMDLVNTFSTEVVAPATDKKEQLKFLTDSVDYFTTHETFNFEDFQEKVIPDEKLATEFKAYQNDYALNEVNNFDISQRAVKTAKRKIKSRIKLDTKIEIRLDFNNPEYSQDFLEKGYDDSREMYYYKVYFNEELD